jgi:hypothetical protein
VKTDIYWPTASLANVNFKVNLLCPQDRVAVWYKNAEGHRDGGQEWVIGAGGSKGHRGYMLIAHLDARACVRACTTCSHRHRHRHTHTHTYTHTAHAHFTKTRAHFRTCKQHNSRIIKNEEPKPRALLRASPRHDCLCSVNTLDRNDVSDHWGLAFPLCRHLVLESKPNVVVLGEHQQ